MARLTYVEHVPAPGLRAHLECLWEVSDASPRAVRPVDRIVPDGCPELIVHLLDPFSRWKNGRWTLQPQGFLAGTLTRPWLLRAGRRVRTLGMRFRAGAPRAFFPVDMAAAADRETPLSSLVGRMAADALMAGLRETRPRARRFALAERFLRDLQATGRRAGSPAQPAVDVISKRRGMVTMDELARSLGWSRRRLERAVRHDLGIRPKMFARIVRLNAVLAAVDHAERARVVDMALDAGYFDEAHLLRDFRTLAGRGPRARREEDGEMARHFTVPARLRALFAGE